MESTQAIFLQTNLTPYPSGPVDQNLDEDGPIVSQEKYKVIPDEERLQLFAITRKEFEAILDYVQNMEPIDENRVIKRFVSGLPFTIACSVDKISTYILFKKHRIEQIAEGSLNSVTFGWDVEAQKEIAFRAGKKETISTREREIYRLLSSRKDLFVASNEIFDYEGPHTDRTLSFKKYSPSKISSSKTEHIEVDQSVQQNKLINTGRRLVPKTGMILEMQDGGCLNVFSITSVMTPAMIFSIAHDVFKGLAVLHEEFGVVHLDIKPDNILLTKDLVAKIADFGHSRYKDEKILEKFTIIYVPPEILKLVLGRLIHTHRADFPGDIWSFGIVLAIIIGWSMGIDVEQEWEKVFNQLVVQKFDRTMLVSNFLSFLKRKIELDGQSEILKIFPLLEKCLVVFPQDRITAREGFEMMEELINLGSI